MVVSICINTYKHPEFLKKLLENLFNQNIPQDITIDVIFVENDSIEQSKSVINFFN